MRSSPAYLTVLCPHAIWTPQGRQSTKIFSRELWFWFAHVTAHCDRRSIAVGQLLTARNMLVAVSARRWPPTHQMHVSNTYQHVQGPRALATGVGCSFAGRQHFTPTNGIAEHAFVWQTCNVVTVQPPAAFIPMISWAVCMLLGACLANIWTDDMRSPYATRFVGQVFTMSRRLVVCQYMCIYECFDAIAFTTMMPTPDLNN